MIKKILLVMLMFFCCGAGFTQTLSQLTKQARLNILLSKDDTSKIRALNKLGNFHLYLFIQYKHQENSDSIFIAYNKAMKIAGGLKTSAKEYWQMVVLSGIGESECYVGDTVNGRKKIRSAIDYFKKHRYTYEELNGWRILGKTAEYYADTKQQLAYLKILENLSLKYRNTNMMIVAKERIIDVIANSTKGDTIKGLYEALIKDYKHTNAPDIDQAYLQLAHYSRYRGNLPAALSYALAAHDWMVRTNDTTDDKKGACYGELAEIYQLLGQSTKSIEWYKKTLVVRRHKNVSQISIYRTAGFLIQEYIKLKKPREALSYIINLVNEYPPLTIDNEANSWQMKAYCYEALGYFTLAETAYLKMLKDYNRVKVQPEIMHLAMYDIGKFYINRKQFNKAALYINSNDLIDWSAVEVKDFHYLLFKIDSANGNYVSAIKHLNSYKNISDSIFNTTKSNQISELEIKYATNQKERDISALKKDRLLQNDKIKQVEYTRNWILTAVVLLLLVLALLYNSFRGNRKKTHEIDLKNASLNTLIAEKDELLQEKEWLMKEIHHRVKNNLQIVMGLLQRQSSFIHHEEALTAIRNSEHRMQSIALIHQKLYQSDSFMLVSMVDYINEMIEYLKECFGLGDKLRFEKSIADIDLEVNIAVPLGLILNEAITNAIKYAFNGKQDFSIRIHLDQIGEHDYILEIADSGPGLPADFDMEKVNTMGFNLIRGLSKQLRGKLLLQNDDGLMIKIVFQKS